VAVLPVTNRGMDQPYREWSETHFPGISDAQVNERTRMQIDNAVFARPCSGRRRINAAIHPPDVAGGGHSKKRATQGIVQTLQRSLFRGELT
jgi:hypothetical protein